MGSIFEPDLFDFGWAGNLAVNVAGSERAETTFFHIRDVACFAGCPVIDAWALLASARPSFHDFDLPGYEHLVETESFLQEGYAAFDAAQRIKTKAVWEDASGVERPAEIAVAIFEFGPRQEKTLAWLIADSLDGSPLEILVAGSNEKASRPDFVLKLSQKSTLEDQNFNLLREEHSLRDLYAMAERLADIKGS